MENRVILTNQNNLPDLSPFSIMKNYYADFKRMNNDSLSNDNEGNIFNQDSR